MKKILSYILLFLFTFLTVASVNAEEIKNFQSNININKDGTINISENINYDFGGVEKHGIYRDIPYVKTNLDKKKYKIIFSDFSVVDESQRPYNFVQSDDGEKISLKIGDANKLITGIHQYIISYKAVGALTYYSDHDELYWNITGNSWTVPIDSSTVIINLPESLDSSNVKLACYTGSIGDNLTLCKTNYQSGKATITADETLSANQGLTAVIGIPKNILAVLEPKEVVDFWQTFIGKIVSFLFGLTALIWYVFFAYLYYLPLDSLRKRSKVNRWSDNCLV